VHIEVKNLCDVSTHIMLFMELQEGKEEMAHLTPSCSNFSTACTLRLVDNWLGRGHVLLADSWLASIKTAVALKSNGVECCGRSAQETANQRKRSQRLLAGTCAGSTHQSRHPVTSPAQRMRNTAIIPCKPTPR
jgi:hypothetical protein